MPVPVFHSTQPTLQFPCPPCTNGGVACRLGGASRNYFAIIIAAEKEKEYRTMRLFVWSLMGVSVLSLCLGCRQDPAGDPPDVDVSQGDTPEGDLSASEPEVEGRPLSDWIARLGSENSANDRVAAAAVLQAAGAKAAPAAPALVAQLEDEDAWIRVAVMEALAEMGSCTVPALLDAFQNGSRSARLRSGVVLRDLGPGAEAALSPLEETLKDEDPAIRGSAAGIIGAIGPKAEPALPALIAALEDEDRGVRERVVVALGQLAPTLPEAVAALEKATEDDDQWVRKEAAEALKNIRREP